MHVLDTSRLHLAPLTQGDEAVYCRLYMDPAVMRHVADPMTPEASLRHFGSALEQQGGKRWLWMITLHGADTASGLLGVVPEPPAAEVGVILFPDAQGRGFAAEVFTAIHPFLFRESGFQRLWTRHAQSNDAARSLMRTLGYQPMHGEPVAGQIRWEMTESLWRDTLRDGSALARPPT